MNGDDEAATYEFTQKKSTGFAESILATSPIKSGSLTGNLLGGDACSDSGEGEQDEVSSQDGGRQGREKGEVEGPECQGGSEGTSSPRSGGSPCPDTNRMMEEDNEDFEQLDHLGSRREEQEDPEWPSGPPSIPQFSQLGRKDGDSGFISPEGAVGGAQMVNEGQAEFHPSAGSEGDETVAENDKLQGQCSKVDQLMNFNCDLEMNVEGKPLDSSLDSDAEDIAVPIKENVENEYEEKEIDESDNIVKNITENNNDFLPEKESDLMDNLLDLKISNTAGEEKMNIAAATGLEADLMTNSNLVLTDDIQMKDEDNKETLESDYGYKLDAEEGSCQLSAVKDQINQDQTNHGQEAEDAALVEIGTLHQEDNVNCDYTNNDRNAVVEDKGEDSEDSDVEADNEGFTVIKEDTNDDDKDSSSSSEGEDDVDSEDSQEDKEDREPKDDLDVPLIANDDIENVISYEELGIEKVEAKISKGNEGEDNNSVIGEELKNIEICSEIVDTPAECNVLDTSFSDPAEVCSKLDLHKHEDIDIESESSDVDEEKQDDDEKEGNESGSGSRRSSIASLSENKGGETEDFDPVPGPVNEDDNTEYEKDTAHTVDQETKYTESEANFGVQLGNGERAKSFDKHEDNLDSMKQSDLLTPGDEDEDCSNHIDGDYQRAGSEFVMNESMVTNISEGKVMDFEINEQIDDFDEQMEKHDSDMKLAEEKLAKFILDEKDTIEQKIDEEEEERHNQDTEEMQEKFEQGMDLYDNGDENLEALSVKTPNPSYTSTENIENIDIAKPLSQSGLEFGLNELAAQQRGSCYPNNEPGTCLELVEGAASTAAGSEHLVSLVEMTENAADLSPLSPALSPAGCNIQTMEEEGTTDNCLKETKGKMEAGEENVSMETSTMETKMVAKSLDTDDVEVTLGNKNHTSRDSSDDEDIQENNLKETDEMEDVDKLEGQMEICEKGTVELSHQDAVLQEDYQHEVLSKFVENEPVDSDNEDEFDDKVKDNHFEDNMDKSAENFMEDVQRTPDQTPFPKMDHDLENTAYEKEYPSESKPNNIDSVYDDLDIKMEEKHTEPMETMSQGLQNIHMSEDHNGLMPEKKEIFNSFENKTAEDEVSLKQYSGENMAEVEDNTKLVESDSEEEFEENNSGVPLINDSQKDISSDMLDRAEPQEIYENESFVLNSCEKDSVSEGKMKEMEKTDMDMKLDNCDFGKDSIEIEHKLNGEKPFKNDATFEIGDENQIVSEIELQTLEQKLTPEVCQVIENEPLMSSDGLDEEKPEQIVETTSELEITQNYQKEDSKDEDSPPTVEVASIIATTITPEEEKSPQIVEPISKMTESDPIIASKEEDFLPIFEVVAPEQINVSDFDDKSQQIVEPPTSMDITENDTMEDNKDDDGLPVAAIAAATTATVAAVAALTAAKASDSKTKTDSDKKAGKPGSGKSAVSGKPAPGSALKKKADAAAKPSPSRSGPGGLSKPTTSAKRPTVPPIKSATTSAQKTTVASAARPGTAQKPLTNGTSSRPASAAAPRPTNRPTTRPTLAAKSTPAASPASISRTPTSKPATAKPAATKPSTPRPTPARPATTRPSTTRPTTNSTTTTPKTPLSNRPATTKPSSAPPRATSRPTSAKPASATPTSRTTTARPSSSTRPRPTTGSKTEASKTSGTTTRTPATRTPLSKPSPRTPSSAPATSKTPSKAPTPARLSARPASGTAGTKKPAAGQTKTPTSRTAGKKLPASGGSSKPVPIKKPGKGEDLGKTEVSVEENVLIEEEKPVNGGLLNGFTNGNGVHDEEEAESVVTNGCNGALDCSEPVH